jgi:hypothetical protein
MTDVEPLATTDYDAPLWLQALTYPAGVDRDLIDAVFATGGVIGGGDFLVAPRGAGANMSVDVAAGKIVVPGTDVSLQGKYVGRMKNTVNVPIAAAPAAGLTRIDLIHAHIADATVIGSGLNSLSIETPVVGTAVSSGWTVPPTPASSVALAQITVASGTAAITAGLIVDVRPRATTPAANLTQAGSTVGTTDAGGNMVKTNYPVAFRAGTTPVVVITSGDVVAFQGHMVTDVRYTDNVGFAFTAYAPGGGPAATTAIRYNWIAYGASP